ncbi:pentatricopeptide repeat-containing protein At4g13650 [Phoenix dactylifera]|uniref:Pentatricopeptide repeat-containing protein At4g13650 n=1 Tax=Phoenix dactylifera TaxID=42345 RepID=A0A8B8JAJ3_PHODC|nr:pentatricopeptide repeat-containing protein At4g13650 [Phoenix dactylifera]XP_026664772.2 pentatricopeptide repeat-containing protein At4g13650 [Phoenix dactylifera]
MPLSPSSSPLMLSAPSSLLGSLSQPSVSLFPRVISSQKLSASHRRLLKLLVGRAAGLIASFSRDGHSAVCQALEESSDGELEATRVEGMPKGDAFFFLHLMEERGVRADCSTYASLLDNCLNSGSLVYAKRIHGKILKLGFDRETRLCNRLIDAYLAFGEFVDAVSMFDDMAHRTVASWNTMIMRFSQRKEHRQVLALFARMMRECRDPNPVAFANALRACNGNNRYWPLVQQIHAKIIRYGFRGDFLVGNPLIDLYAKNGYVDLARLVFEELYSKDNVSWVAMVSGFSQNGLGAEALHLYSQMHRSGIVPTPYVLSSVLSACTKTDHFEHGKQIHAQVIKQGFSSETFVGNALVTLYSRCGSLRMAEEIFSEMPNHDGVTYNTLISGHAQNGNSESAIEIFKEMQLSGFKPDSVTIASLLTACASIGDIRKGKQLHSYVFKTGLSSEYIIEGSLLDLYVKCAAIETAHEFFNTTDRENVVLWNVMLVAYGQMGNLRKSFDLFYQMQVEGVQPNQYTYPSILRTCTYVGALDLGEQIHTLTIKTGFELNVYVSSVLIDMYSKCGQLKSARAILERLTEKDVVSWTAMIAGYAQHELYVEALRTFEEMQIHGIRPDNIGLASAISACAGIKAIEQGLQIHAQACISGYSTDISVGNALINLYARCGRIEEAYSALETVEVKDEISWNGLISGLAQSGHCEEALKVFLQMDREGVKASSFTFGSAVSASANMADIKQGKQIHARIIKTGFDSEIEVSNALVSLYAKCGSIEDAKMGFFGMSGRNEVSWNAMITGYSQHGCGREALKLFEKMKQEDLKPNGVTFIGVLAACSHVGLVNEGLDYFKSMDAEHGIVPRPEHYACVVDILGRAGQLDRAREFIEEMPIAPDAMVWRTLLSACTVHKNMEIGELAAQHLLELEPHDSATYVLLSNLYAVAGKWNQRDQVRQMMKDRRVKKEPGRSWIGVKNEVHAFFVGDRLHPLADMIYEFLKDLNERAVEIGYRQDRYYLLHDIEQERKDPTACIHSEKLAVAFGLLSLSPEVPLQVFKNLRVCNDCHIWMKYVSRISGRAIILRDAYRFHHFEGGNCSCADYW